MFLYSRDFFFSIANIPLSLQLNSFFTAANIFFLYSQISSPRQLRFLLLYSQDFFSSTAKISSSPQPRFLLLYSQDFFTSAAEIYLTLIFLYSRDFSFPTAKISSSLQLRWLPLYLHYFFSSTAEMCYPLQAILLFNFCWDALITYMFHTCRYTLSFHLAQ